MVPKRAFRGLIALVFCCVAFRAPSLAAAQDDDGARLHFQAGARDFAAGRYESALRSFEEAYRLSNRAALLYNIAICHQELGHTEEAATNLRRFLESVEDVPDRDVLEARLQRLEAAAAREREEAAAAEPVAPEPEPAPPTDTADDDDGRGGFGLRGGAWISWGVGGGALVTGVALGSAGLAQKNEFESTCGPTRSCDRAEVERMERFGLVADISFGIAIAGAATGTILWLVAPDDDDDDSGVSATAAPWVVPGGAGLSLTGRF